MDTLIGDIKLLAQNIQVNIQHIYREGNTLTDYIANFALENEGNLIYN